MRQSSQSMPFPPVMSLLLVFSFVDPLEDGESRLFGIGDRHGLELDGGIERGKDLSHRLFARRTIRQRFG